MAKRKGHDARGRFAQGNEGGPGRPRRTVEREYLAALSESVSLDDWREVCKRAVADARKGDGKARDWLTGYLLGDAPAPMRLIDLAVRDVLGVDVEAEIAAEVEAARAPTETELLNRLAGPSIVRRALKLSEGVDVDG